MFINFEKFTTLNLTEQFIFTLCAVKNKATIYLEDNFEVHRLQMEDKGYIKYVKPTRKGQPLYELVRIDKKGEKLLKDLSSATNISEDTKVLGEWLIKYYKDKKGGIVKNKTETLRRLQWFTDETGIVKNDLAVLLKNYLSDVYDPDCGLSITEAKEQNPRLQLSYEVANIFWRPRDNFDRHYKLDDSPLYNYYLEFIC